RDQRRLHVPLLDPVRVDAAHHSGVAASVPPPPAEAPPGAAGPSAGAAGLVAGAAGLVAAGFFSGGAGPASCHDRCRAQDAFGWRGDPAANARYAARASSRRPSLSRTVA